MDRIVVHTNFTEHAEARPRDPRSRTSPTAAQPGDPARRLLRARQAAARRDERRRITEEAAAQHRPRSPRRCATRGLEPRGVAHFLDRIIFCLFAEDIGLLPERSSSPASSRSARHDPDAVQPAARRALRRDGERRRLRRRRRSAHFNGNLFDATAIAPDADRGRDRPHLAGVAALDWSAVEPSIFGTLFERGLDPAKRVPDRRALHQPRGHRDAGRAGRHAPLRREWDESARGGDV